MSTSTTASGVHDLWPKEIEQVVLTPLAIMRIQAAILRDKTKNLLEAEIESTEIPTNRIKHTFILVAPALERYTYSLFAVKHDVGLVYPAAVESQAVQDVWKNDAVAATQEEFTHLIFKVLNDNKTKAVISSLLARSNEASVG